jgi:hypothetical protein
LAGGVSFWLVLFLLCGLCGPLIVLGWWWGMVRVWVVLKRRLMGLVAHAELSRCGEIVGLEACSRVWIIGGGVWLVRVAEGPEGVS